MIHFRKFIVRAYSQFSIDAKIHHFRLIETINYVCTFLFVLPPNVLLNHDESNERSCESPLNRQVDNRVQSLRFKRTGRMQV